MRDGIRELATRFGTGSQLDIAARPKTQEQIEAEEAYSKKLAAAMSPKRVTEISFSQQVDYATACDEFRKIREERWEIKRRSSNPDFAWSFSPEDKAIIGQLIRYFINDPVCIWSLTKGLWLWSGVGVGKTEIVQLMSKFTKKLNLSKSFNFVNMSEEYDTARNDKNCNNLDKLIQGNKCFDEFLYRHGDVNSYGNKINLNESIIESRYIRNQKYGQITHLISNVSPLESETILNARITDRLMEMCTVVEWKGESKRK